MYLCLDLHLVTQDLKRKAEEVDRKAEQAENKKLCSNTTMNLSGSYGIPGLSAPPLHLKISCISALKLQRVHSRLAFRLWNRFVTIRDQVVFQERLTFQEYKDGLVSRPGWFGIRCSGVSLHIYNPHLKAQEQQAGIFLLQNLLHDYWDRELSLFR